MRLQSCLYKILVAVMRRIDDSNLFINQISFLKGRRLHKKWQKNLINTIPEMEILRRIIKSDDIVFDIGANVGEFSFFLSTLVSNGLIYSFEPQNKLFKVLQSTCLRKKTLIPMNLGFSNLTGSATLFIPIVKGNVSHREASLDPKFNDFTGYEKNIKSTGSVKEEIHLTTLDEFCRTNSLKSLNFVKIDVEGHELKILHGGNNLCLKIYRPIFLIEVFPYVYSGHFDKVCDHMKESNYLGFVMRAGGEVEALTMNNLENSPGFNYFFVPQEKSNEFLSRIGRNPHDDSSR